MGKKYNSDGSKVDAFADAANLSGSDISRIQGRLKREVPALIEAGQLEILAQVAAMSPNRLEKITTKMPEHAQILAKLSEAVDIVRDPTRLSEWKKEQSQPTEHQIGRLGAWAHTGAVA